MEEKEHLLWNYREGKPGQGRAGMHTELEGDGGWKKVMTWQKFLQSLEHTGVCKCRSQVLGSCGGIVDQLSTVC